MAAGDLKGEECVCIKVTLGATTTKGQVIHLEADGKWDPVADQDKGKFAVALEGGADTEQVMACIWGRVEVTATAAAIAKGATVMAGNTGLVAASDYAVLGENVGTAMEAFASGGTQTVWIGLVN